MKKFAFALDKVLEFKRQYEDSIRNEHAAIMHEIRLQEERFAELSAKDKEIRDQMRREQEVGCQILRIHTFEGYLEYLKGEKIYVRHFNSKRIKNYLRVTIGTREQMEAVFAALRTWISSKEMRTD